ncbi:Pex19 protein [Basidiobolus meristosporus CBS 931.73]|uniref:Pex19 protein n=1 Tax=Basidiobolus meristosporus CBS 931.73 TaxID=1314790 RepID=A0A1Y1YHR9_9FUNG|nr:Pex19 protein [Basidiobolus meristosporus CBS 931.73]|eukprot:ORX97581.1 Pex19 protein [Basidiobolus meristosporus CBS 931.73]
MTKLENQVTVEDDPELDDLLDGALEDFSKPIEQPKQVKQEPQPEESGEKSEFDALFEDEFAKQLAEGMEEFMKEMNGDDSLKQTFEQLLGSFDQNDFNPSASLQPNPKKKPEEKLKSSESSTSTAPASFQEKVEQTMNKLRDSSEQVQAEVNEESSDAMLSEMIKQMESLTGSGEFDNVVEGMMGQLLTKDILYEPMRELASKYPDWLKANKEALAPEEYKRYETQYSYVTQIVEHFESENTDNPKKKSVMDLMQGMQECGQPPADILKELAPDMALGPDGLPQIPDIDQCNIM